MRTHTSKVDKWYLAVVISIVVLPFILGAVFGGFAWLAVFICWVTAAFMFWLYLATKYVVTADELVIYGGVMKVTVPRASITAITETSDVISSPAYSLDRLEIKYGEGKIILVSPKDKAAFLADLDWPKSA